MAAYRVLVTAILVVHFAFLGYVVAGGFAAWRWPRAVWPHLVACGWGVAVVAVPLDCPLTAAENWGRQRAGGAVPERGFIDRYLEGVIYPERHTYLLWVLVALVVAGSWAGAYLSARRRAARRASPG